MTPAECAEFGNTFFKWFLILAVCGGAVTLLAGWLSRDQY